MTERLRKFFRIRGKTGFLLDEIVAPVVLVQDLTQGPYQAGVTPGAGQSQLTTQVLQPWAYVIMMNDKPGSLTPILSDQFNDRSFSFTQAEIQNNTDEVMEVSLQLVPRAAVIANPTPPAGANSLASIQNSDGTLKIPVEIFAFVNTTIAGGTFLWRGILGDNVNTVGVRRNFDNLIPNITIGPNDALMVTNQLGGGAGAVGTMFLSVRGFYQEQPA